jgi:hypothetical protein
VGYGQDTAAPIFNTFSGLTHPTDTFLFISTCVDTFARGGYRSKINVPQALKKIFFA